MTLCREGSPNPPPQLISIAFNRDTHQQKSEMAPELVKRDAKFARHHFSIEKPGRLDIQGTKTPPIPRWSLPRFLLQTFFLRDHHGLGARKPWLPEEAQDLPHRHDPNLTWRVFYIFIFFKIVFTEIYFRFHNLQVYTPAAPLPGGRGLYVIKICVLSHEGPYRPAGGRQAPPNIKAEVPPPAFAANNIHRGKKERRGVRGGSCNSEALSDFGSEPHVTNISQLCHSKFFVFLIL